MQDINIRGGGRIRIQAPIIYFENGSSLLANGESGFVSGGGSGGTVHILGGRLLVCINEGRRFRILLRTRKIRFCFRFF